MFHLTIISILIFAQTLFSDDINIKQGLYRLSYDSVKLPVDETMGLAGINYLYKTEYDFYYGLGAYAALDGQRGGFFTGGIEIGKYFLLDESWLLDIGVFLGGGGGGSAPQGGGLMLRPHAGIIYKMNYFDIGLSASRIEFPNGNISSNQVSIQIEVPFKSIHSSNNKSFTLDDIVPITSKYGDIGWSNSYISMLLQNYYIPDDMINLDGEDHIGIMNVIGIEYGSFLNQNLFALISAAGAYGGNADGYAEVFTGMGYKYKLNKYFGLLGKVAVGGAGGGRIDSAGGISYKAEIGGYTAITPNLQLDIGIGHIESFKGEYEAKILKTNLTYNMDILSFVDSPKKISLLHYDLAEWEVRVTNQTYLESPKLRTNKEESDEIHLLGLKFDRFITNNIYLTGQSNSAYAGNSGGYASGLFGFGYLSNKYFKKLSFLAEANLGAAGGGSVDVGGGAVAQIMAGIDYKLSENLSMQAQIGQIRAFNGLLNTGLIDVGIAYRFNSIERTFK